MLRDVAPVDRCHQKVFYATQPPLRWGDNYHGSPTVIRNMEQGLGLKIQIQSVLDCNGFAVLATQRSGQPHTSLMAFSPVRGIRYLVFATYRRTLKYRSLLTDARMALLIDGQNREGTRPNSGFVLTALGEANEIPEADRQAAVCIHLARHPDLQEFLRSPDCALMRVTVAAYEVVGGIDDVRWYQVQDHPCDPLASMLQP